MINFPRKNNNFFHLLFLSFLLCYETKNYYPRILLMPYAKMMEINKDKLAYFSVSVWKKLFKYITTKTTTVSTNKRQVEAGNNSKFITCTQPKTRQGNCKTKNQKTKEKEIYYKIIRNKILIHLQWSIWRTIKTTDQK